MREVTSSARRETSALRCCTSANGSETAATVGVATSTILSAMSASLDRSVVSSAEASTMRTLAGGRVPSERRCCRAWYRGGRQAAVACGGGVGSVCDRRVLHH